MSENVFDLLEKNVAKLAKRRFDVPTDIQKEVFPKILDGKNILIISQTGSGKTLAALLPIFDKLSREEHKQISLLYITPLRSLNRNLLDRIVWWCNKLDLDVAVRHGDTTQYERSKQAENPSDILISTPETLQAVLVGSKMRENLKYIKYIVIDEIHELVTNKRGIQLSVALERLKELKRKHGLDLPQIIGLSATIGSPEEVADFIRAKNIVDVTKTKKISLKVESPKPKKEDIKTSIDLKLSPETTARLKRISYLIKDKESVLIFTNTRESAEILSSRMKLLGDSLETHHSSLSKDVRIDVEKGFKEKKIKSLVCTSSLELGIDIGSIDYVVQYMSPRQVTKLLQRIGRSGHKIGLVSNGVIIASDVDDCFESTAIANMALKHDIEPTEIYNKSLDVLAHQIVGLSLEYYEISLKEIYNIVKRAYPYRNLTELEFLEVCQLLEQTWLIWLNRSESDSIDLTWRIKRRKRSWEYYYGNLSTIPDTKNYKVIDIVNNKSVGSLDEEFVALNCHRGAYFICKGQSWRVLDVRKRKIIVEPSSNLDASIPSWEGELIPVQLKVAQEVGRIRSLLKEKGLKILENYPISKDVAKKIYDAIKKQEIVPTDKKILIEYGSISGPKEESYEVIIHTCFGSKVNDTIGRLITTILADQIGSVGLQTDPYRIIIKLPVPVYSKVIEIFKNLKKYDIDTLINQEIKNGELFAWKFIHVSKRFGIIKRDVDYGKAYIRKIIEIYKNSPIEKEVLNEIIQEKLDIKNTKTLLEKLKDFEIIVKDGISYLGSLALERRYEIIPGKTEYEILKIFEKRLKQTKLGFVCCSCGWNIKSRAENPYLECKSCKSKIMSVVPERYIEEASQLIKSYKGEKKLSKQELKWLDMILNSGSMVQANGEKAVLCLAARGVGVKTASRILRKPLDDKELLEEILNAERSYIRTKKFWKS